MQSSGTPVQESHMIFSSDNQACASQQVMESILEANRGFARGYGDDEWSKRATDELRRVFECDLEAHFVATGTAANCLALSCLAQPWETILCHACAHILVDESTAPEFFTGGARMLAISQGDGKLSADHMQDYFRYARADFPHNSQAGALSITQATEAGLVYTPEEIGAISKLCKEKGLNIHMDGARFANALVALDCTPAELTWKSGVDVLCLGATKCGALCAEAVIFFDRTLCKEFAERRKRSGHLVSKGRLFGAQFVGWLRDDHWLDLARLANSQAAQLHNCISTFEEIQIVWPVQSNQIFAIMPGDLAAGLQKAGAEFYDWSPEALPKGIRIGADEVFVRLVTSFLSTDEDCMEFSRHIGECLSKR
jgi:threonine aldolase